MSKTPDNAAALEIVRLRSVSSDIDEQIIHLRNVQSKNSEIIGALDLTAQWIEDEPTGVHPELGEPVGDGS